MKKLILICLLLQLTTFSFGQDFLTRRISFEIVNLPIDQALSKLAEESGIDIAFTKNFFRDTGPITASFEDVPIQEILDYLLKDTGINYKTLGNNRVLLFRAIDEYKVVSGYLQEVESGEQIVGGRVFMEGTNDGALTNEYGYFSFKTPVENTSVIVRALGYKSTNFQLSKDKTTALLIKLEPIDALPEIVVNADEDRLEFARAARSLDRDNILEISRGLPQKLPTLGGSADIVQIAQLMPGVQGQADGFGGINIRGGESGQNLMLMDGTPVYIPYHLLGLYSTYNPEIVRSLRLVEGNFPARYGDAVSAILDIQIREGDRSHFRSTYELNLLSGNAVIEGPLKNKKGSFLLAGRFSPVAYFFKPVLSRLYFQNQIDLLNTQFYDFNIKLNYDLTPKDRLFLSFFDGNDAVFQSALTEFDVNNKIFSAFDLNWKNLVGSLRWNHLFGPKLFVNTTFTISHYATQFTSQSEYLYEDAMAINKDFFLIDNRSKNTDLGLKLDADYAWKKRHNLRFGGNFNVKRFTPGFYFFQETKFDIKDENLGNDLYDINLVYENLNVPVYLIQTGSLYLEDQFHKGRWYANIGSRLSGFLSDSSAFLNIEPRIMVKFKLNEKWTTSLSANRRIQYLHLIANPSIQLPNDLWLPSGARLKPQEVYEVEYRLNYLVNKKLRIEMAAYDRHLFNLYTYPETFDFLYNTEDYNRFDFLVKGKGRNQGIELIADYSDSKRGLLINYTLSKSMRQFDSINLGKPFASNFDSRHQLKLSFHQNLSKSFGIGMNWVFRSPSPKVNVIQFASSGTFTNITQDPPGFKNTTRSTLYNRIDISMQYQLFGEKIDHQFKFGVYNVLNRSNTAFYEIQYIDVATNEIFSTPLKSLPILPSFSYKILFK